MVLGGVPSQDVGPGLIYYFSFGDPWGSGSRWFQPRRLPLAPLAGREEQSEGWDLPNSVYTFGTSLGSSPSTFQWCALGCWEEVGPFWFALAAP